MTDYLGYLAGVRIATEKYYCREYTCRYCGLEWDIRDFDLYKKHVYRRDCLKPKSEQPLQLKLQFPKPKNIVNTRCVCCSVALGDEDGAFYCFECAAEEWNNDERVWRVPNDDQRC